MNTIDFKGISSTTIDGLLICELPPISKPPMRVLETSVDGRHGTIIDELGYTAYDKTVHIGLRGTYDINKVIKFFSGEGDIVFSNEPDKVYRGRVIGQVDYTRLVRFKQANVTFRVQPFKHKNREAFVEAQTTTASGTNIVLTDGANAMFKSFRIFGKSTQNGTPTPTAPVEIVSLCADGTISVSANETTFDLAIVNGLKAIPVTDASLATYTDASGKMWCADEIDIKRGVYIKRVQEKKITATASALYQPTEWQNKTAFVLSNWFADAFPVTGYATKANLMSTHFSTSLPRDIGNGIVNAVGQGGNFGNNLFLSVEGLADATAVAGWLTNNSPSIDYILATPIEIALTDDEISACKNILNNEMPTTIANDENAHMAVEYFKPFEVFNEGLETSKPLIVLRGSGTVEMKVNGLAVFTYTFPDGEDEVVLDCEAEEAYLGAVLKNRNMLGEFPELQPKTNKVEWSGDVKSIQILPRSRWL